MTPKLFTLEEARRAIMLRDFTGVKVFSQEGELGEFVEKSMTASGYVSTSVPDFGGDVVYPEGGKAHFHYYQNNPVYLWQHDRMTPIGHVENPYIDSKGVYLDKITFAPTTFNKEFVWPLVKHGSIKQQSIGMFALEMEENTRGGYDLKEWLMFEGSLVTIAQNPTAFYDRVKSMDLLDATALKELPEEDIPNIFNTVEDVLRAYEKGLIRLKTEVSCQFALTSNPLASKAEEPTMDQKETLESRLVVTKADNSLFNQDSEASARYPKYHRAWEVQKEQIYAYVREDGEPMLPLGDPTVSGEYRYDFAQVAKAMLLATGARAVLSLSPEDRQAIVVRISEAYKALGQPLPLVKDIEICDYVGSYAVEDITFRAGEKALFALANLEEQLQTVGLVSPEVETPIVKEALVKEASTVMTLIQKYVEVFVSISGYAWSDEDLAFFEDLVARARSHKYPKDEEEADDNVLTLEATDEGTVVKDLSDDNVLVQGTLEDPILKAIFGDGV